MSLRQFETVPYIPFLSLRPAEMRALEELPILTKDRLLPVVHLRAWSSANYLQSGLDRIATAYGSRPIVLGIGDVEVTESWRPVHAELELLRDPANGFNNWCNFVELHGNYIPAMQFGPSSDQDIQVSRLHSLGRGLFVILPPQAFGSLEALGARVGRLTSGGTNVCFVLDFQTASSDHLQAAALSVGYLTRVTSVAPNATIAISASSFPSTFKGVPEQPIYERRLFDQVAGVFDSHRLVYSDRGSARVEHQSGGSGTPMPRIDYPLRMDWRFFRSDAVTGFDGYKAQARILMLQAAIWNPNLRVWGTQMIERTASGDMSAISNPNKATAARINLHLQVQTFFENPDAAEQTDEDWQE